MDDEKEGREIDSDRGCIKISGVSGHMCEVGDMVGVLPAPPPLTGPALGLTLGPAPSVSREPLAEPAGPWPGPWVLGWLCSEPPLLKSSWSKSASLPKDRANVSAQKCETQESPGTFSHSGPPLRPCRRHGALSLPTAGWGLS